jgi:hypothetical protein
MTPHQAALLRRHWQLVAAVLVFAAFALVHVLVFQPAARRYHLALKRAADLGMPLETEAPPPMMPPRVLALLVDNALPSGGDAGGNAGALTSALLEDLTQLTNKHGMQVLMTEPGTTAQQAHSVQVRAHLRIRCSFSQFVSFLDDLSRSHQLIAIERFSLSHQEGTPELDLWVNRYVLKQTQTGKRT